MQLYLGQILPPERREIKMALPVTEKQMQAFKLGMLEMQVLTMTMKLPIFAAKDVREYTKRLLVAGVAKLNNIGEGKVKYCKFYKIIYN